MPSLFLLVWLITSYSVLFLLRFLLTARFAGLGLLLFHRSSLGHALFNILLFPGVVIHELSHFLIAAALGVPTGNINFFPHQDAGEHRLGSVQVAHTDPLRESLIGAAPLLIASISLVALIRWQFPSLFSINAATTDWLVKLQTPQTWLWFYLIFAMSNTMFTSKSDRRAWPFMLGLLLLIGVIIFGLRGVATLRQLLFPIFTSAMFQLNVAFTFTIGLDLGCLSILWLIEQLLSRLSGRRLHYSSPW